MRGFKKSMWLLAVVMLMGLWTVSPALAEDKPHYGGVLRVALAGDPPSLDMHQEQTFMVTILSPEELQALPGFGKDHEANLREAKRLLAEAGYPGGFHTVLTNRAVKLPYIDLRVYIVSAWKKIGVEAEHKLEESASWSKARLTRDFELLVDPFGFAAEGDPDEVMVKFTSGSPSNWGRFKDPVVDQLFERQKVERDAQKRAQLVHDMQKRLMDQVWEIVGLWWTRVEVRSARLHNYEPLPSHWMNRRLEDVWLSTK